MHGPAMRGPYSSKRLINWIVIPTGKVITPATRAAPSTVGRTGGAVTPCTAQVLRFAFVMRPLTQP